MPSATFQLALPVTKLPQTYALDRVANGIGDCGVTRLKVRDWERKLDSEMSIAVGQRKAMCVHINRAQLLYLCFVMRLCFVSTLHSASLKFPLWDSMTVVLVSLT
jgi:hypothetical protein